MNWLLLAQTTSPDSNVAALVRRLVRGGLGVLPGSVPGLLLLLVGWLAVLAVLAGLLQRDWAKWLRGLVDVRAHVEQLGTGLEILRRNKRPLWVVLAGAVISWTSWSLRTWQEVSSKDELEAILALYGNSAGSFAAAHALAAALVPLRDWLSLGDLLPLVLGACVVLFARTGLMAQHLRSRLRAAESVRLKRRLGTIWVGLIVLAVYRALTFLVDPSAAPLADCMYINVVVLPVLLLAADAMLLSWVLGEFAYAVLGRLGWQADDSVAFVRGMPAAALVCVLSNPGRYLILACAVWECQFSMPTAWPASRWTAILWAGTAAQILGLTWFAFPAVLALWRRGGLADKFRAYLLLWRRVGGQIVGLTALAVLLNFFALLPIYWIFGSMPRETWSFLGAASYGHYATLLLGGVLLAGTTQLAHRELGLEENQGPIATVSPSPESGPSAIFNQPDHVPSGS